MNSMYTQILSPELENARLEAVDKFAILLTAEISLAQHGGGFFEQKFWHDYLLKKYDCQDSSNRFYVLLHEISK